MVVAMIAWIAGRWRRWLRVLSVGFLRGGLLAILWVLLAGWDRDYVGYGVVSVLAATALSLAMFPVHSGGQPAASSLRRQGDSRQRGAPSLRQRITAIMTLPLWFIWKSMVGGVDVAWRALRSPVDIEPIVVKAECQLPNGNSLQMALLMMNLMPGTMVQRVIGDGDCVELHTLSAALQPEMQWENLQRRVAAAFGDPSMVSRTRGFEARG